MNMDSKHSPLTYVSELFNEFSNMKQTNFIFMASRKLNQGSKSDLEFIFFAGIVPIRSGSLKASRKLNQGSKSDLEFIFFAGIVPIRSGVPFYSLKASRKLNQGSKSASLGLLQLFRLPIRIRSSDHSIIISTLKESRKLKNQNYQGSKSESGVPFFTGFRSSKSELHIVGYSYIRVFNHKSF
ncbi:hypothetical protein LXL04_010692 [Taraxacum kok-saghyz]